MPKYAARIDESQPEIVEELRARGFSYWHTHTLGQGGGDGVMGKFGFTAILEIKTWKAFNRADFGLTPAEKKFHDSWKGAIIIGFDAEQIEARFLELMEELQSR